MHCRARRGGVRVQGNYHRTWPNYHTKLGLIILYQTWPNDHEQVKDSPAGAGAMYDLGMWDEVKDPKQVMSSAELMAFYQARAYMSDA